MTLLTQYLTYLIKCNLDVLRCLYSVYWHFLFKEPQVLELHQSICFSHITPQLYTTDHIFRFKTSQAPTHWPVSPPPPLYSLTLLPHACAAPIPYTASSSATGIHIPINGFSSQGRVNIPWCHVMEPPGGLQLARITEHPSEMVASFLLSSLSGGLCRWDSILSCLCISSSYEDSCLWF